MESLNPYLERLITLTNLATRVEYFASLCLPDFVYTDEETRDLGFTVVDLYDFGLERHPKPIVGISMKEDKPIKYVFTKWSRAQLLTMMGTKEKWFGLVTRDQEVEELNIRRHALRQFMFRTMRSFDDDDLRLVRGIVSKSYKDIPDTSIMKTVVEMIPKGYALSGFSGKTDRAFYAYIVTGEPVGIPGTDFNGFSGLVVKNSEVGFTSLWVVPMLWMAKINKPVILVDKVLLQRIHRGKNLKLADHFTEAMEEAKKLWGPLQEKLPRLRQISYPNEDAAVEAMTKMLTSAGAQQLFAFRCDQAYRAAQHLVHNALVVFETILGRITEEDQDDAYVSAALAGAVLMYLIK